MACAPRKRALDCESSNQRPSKRRRCNPFGQVAGSPTSSRSCVSVNSGAGCSSSGGHSAFEGYAGTGQSPNGSRNPNRDMSASPSVFSEARISKISPDKMARDIRDEIKRLHKRKQLPFERMQDSETSGSEMGPDSPPGLVHSHPASKALFTFKQVQLICERMLKEREEEIREKYDAVLNKELAEQYDAFVKFTYDQIQRRYDSTPSYLS